MSFRRLCNVSLQAGHLSSTPLSARKVSCLQCRPRPAPQAPLAVQQGKRHFTVSPRPANKTPPSSSKVDELIASITKEAEEKAKLGEGFDINASKSAEDFDPERVNALQTYAQTHWRPYRNLPPGWHSKWLNWDLHLTFYYPTPYYFLLVPQIDMMLNVRYAIPGQARPLMYNNAKEAWFFDVWPRDVELDLNSREDAARKLYYLDWEKEELWAVKGERTFKEVCRDMSQGGLEALELEKVECDVEGEAIIDRVMEDDESAIPLLVERLGYVPAPAEELSLNYLDRTEEVLGRSLDADEEVVPEDVRKESEMVYEEVLQMLREEMKGAESEEVEELAESLKEMAPEEMKPLRDLLGLLRQTKGEKKGELGEVFLKQVMQLEKDVQEEGRILGELLLKEKKKV
ncbi:hypothetical protein DFP72DRAFT_1075752 [Ephemerocybe angulata]|uniref:Uncharacterized protein n=1 Tax=Ephemerocybe angulata TaxID=980116 RepID=A0A8H6M0B6_9AGAR|nr:hypothetical protein DFP72DRAFT_1075752 [Tulosesus angulatus]